MNIVARLLVLASLATALLIPASPVTLASASTPVGCVAAPTAGDPTVVACDHYSVDPADSDATPDLVASCLVAAGWRGQPDVPGDVIVAPWSAIESCASRDEAGLL